MKNKKVKVSILGATGYAGAELFRILLNHPFVQISAISSVSYEGKNINEIYPNYINIENFILLDQDSAIEKGEVIFAALPHGLSEEIAAKCIEKNKIFIDLGADFRLGNEDEFKKWYGNPYNYKELHKDSVYGLPELNREKIKTKNIIGNPGCYPTSISLGLYPAIKNCFIKNKNIICDCKSGVTGAGRGLSQATHFPDCNESFAPYKIGNHRHTPEIEETLSNMAGEKITVTFVPHLLPVNRGILSTMYCEKNTDKSLEEIYLEYKKFYEEEYFVRVLPLGEAANIKNVKLSNFCDISLHEDKHSNKLIVVAAIDNVVKGAAGQAIQNMNIRLGFDESTSLNIMPASF